MSFLSDFVLLSLSLSLFLLFKEHIPDVELIGKRGQELHYLLPLQQSRPAVLQGLFAGLDEAGPSTLGIQQYGLTSCAMEEVSLLRESKRVYRDILSMYL